MGVPDKVWRELAYQGFLERVLHGSDVGHGAPKSGVPENGVPKTDHARAHAEQGAARALVGLRDLLPSYRDLCGAAPYYYAAGEVQRLEHRLVEVYSLDELTQMSETIQAQLEGMARAIRTAKGRGVELDG